MVVKFNERQTRIIKRMQEEAEAAYFVAARLRDRDINAASNFQQMAADYSWAVRRVMGIE